MKNLNESPLVHRVKLNEDGPESAPYGRIGNMWSARPHKYRAGSVHKGHHHITPHVTYLEEGTVSIKRNDRDQPKEYTGPMWIDMPAEIWHEITAKTDAFWWCIFFNNKKSEDKDAPFDAERG